MNQETPVWPWWATALGLLGVVLYFVVGYLYMVSGLAVPIPWILILWGMWAWGLYLVFRSYRTNRAWIPLIAVGAAAFWALFLWAGGTFLGWTA